MRGVDTIDVSPKGLLLSWLHKKVDQRMEDLSNDYLRTRLNTEHYLKKEEIEHVNIEIMEFIGKWFEDGEPHSEWLEVTKELDELIDNIVEKQDD